MGNPGRDQVVLPDDSCVVCVTANTTAGEWSAWVVFGYSSGHATAQEAVDRCLQQAKPYVGMRTYGDLERKFGKALGR